MKDTSIEYAHIYTNSFIDDEHKKSLEILDQIKSKNTQSISLCVMVDDYSFPDPSFDYDKFVLWLDEAGHTPDIFIRESQLIPDCDTVIGLVNDELLKCELLDYIRNKKYPCSLFIATWYLIRLGVIRSDVFPETEISKELVNILPLSFKPFEERGLKIIRATEHKQLADHINYEFIDGRAID